jgi:hypothetical protein
MGDKINIILMGYANKISEAQRKLEYYLNHDSLFEDEITNTLNVVISYESKINKLKFYIDNNEDAK